MSKNPFIPLRDADLVIIDGRVPKEAIEKIESLNIKVIPTIPCQEVAAPISYHPDIVIHPINHKTIIVAPNVFEYYSDVLSKTGIRVIKGEKELKKEYPADIAYNVGRVDNLAIHNFKYTDEKLIYYLEKEGLEFLNVKQGYTKCSIAIVDRKAVITSDYPIYKKLTEIGIDVLLIEAGYIRLDGYPYGFVGGTCGNLSREIVAFSGKFLYHPAKNEITNFLKKYNKKVLWLSDENVTDIGTIISLNYH